MFQKPHWTFLVRRHVNGHQLREKRLSMLITGKIQIEIPISSYYKMNAIIEKVVRGTKEDLGRKFIHCWEYKSVVITENCMDFSFKNGSAICYASGWVYPK